MASICMFTTCKVSCDFVNVHFTVTLTVMENVIVTVSLTLNVTVAITVTVAVTVKVKVNVTDTITLTVTVTLIVNATETDPRYRSWKLAILALLGFPQTWSFSSFVLCLYEGKTS